MIIIGERLNSSCRETRLAMENNDAAVITAISRAQFDAGADYLDINAAMFLDKEADKLAWAARLCARPEGRVSLDSPNASAIEAVLEEFHFSDVLINSITLQKARYESFLPLVKKYNAAVVALPLDDGGMPQDAEQRVKTAQCLIECLRKEGIEDGRIYMDIMVEAAAAGQSPRHALDAACMLRQEFPHIHILCGLSNISFGLPGRKTLNMAFLTAAIQCGVDSAIMDVTDRELRHMMRSALVMAGSDEYCLEYLGFCKREGIS